MRMFHRRDEGFTLVELMVVVLIIGILVAIAIPVFNAARAQAQLRACHANQRTVDGAARTFQAENNALPTALQVAGTDAGFVGPYIKAAPVCPAEGDYTWDDTDGELSCDVHARYDD